MTSSELAHDVAVHFDTAFSGIGQLDITPLHIPSLLDTGAARSRSFEPLDQAPSVDESGPVYSQAEACTEAQDDGHVLPAPIHPIPCMQKEFEESIAESMEASSPTLRDHNGDAAARRRQLLELEDLSEEYSSRWRQKSGAKYHPLRKLIAQIVYGIYLLHNRKAVSDHEVVKILQGHVDEIDGFVEDTLADFELAQKDITQRIEHLSLPLEHSRTFNRMLCERTFRESIIGGNEIIERVIIRTSVAMKRAMVDVGAGLEATIDLAQYLKSLGADWVNRSQDLSDVYEAMIGNADGWTSEFGHLQQRSLELEKTMLRLGLICDEVAKRAGIASRRKTPSGVVGRRSEQQSPESHPLASKTPIGTYTSKSMEKPLPRPPPRISTNPSVTLPWVSSPRPSPYIEAAHRQSLSTSPSLQTLDCLHLPPQRLDADRPGSSSSSSASPRTVRFLDDLSASSPLGRGQSRKTTPQPVHRDSGVTMKSAMAKIGPPRNGSIQNLSRQPTPTPRSEATGYGRTKDVLADEGVAGLGIIGSVNNDRPPAISQAPRDVPTCILKVVPLRPPVIRAPASDPIPYAEAGPGGILQRLLTPLPLKPISRPMSRSISIFPSLADPRERRPRTDKLMPTIAKAKSHINLKADNNSSGSQMLAGPSETPMAGIAIPVPRAQPAVEEVAFFGMANRPVELPAKEPVLIQHAQLDMPQSHSPTGSQILGSVSDVPDLSSAAHAASDSMATVSSFSPQTPDDFLPIGGLRSHPVTPTPEDTHTRKTSVTALPVFPTIAPTNASTSRLPTFAPSMDIDDDFFIVEAKKRAMIPKKPSLAAMRTLFTRKKAARDMRLGAGGLGGFVAPIT